MRIDASLQKYGGRKFILCVAVLATTTGLTWFTKLDGATYSLVILGTVGAFITGNVAESIKSPTQKATQ